MQQLDQIKLDSFRFKTPSGQVITPHAGQSVWVRVYGRTAEDIESIRRVGSAFGRGDPEADERMFPQMKAFLASEIRKHNVIDPNSGEEFPPVTAGNIGEWPSELFAFLIRRLVGDESVGEGLAASGGSSTVSEESVVQESRTD